MKQPKCYLPRASFLPQVMRATAFCLVVIISIVKLYAAEPATAEQPVVKLDIMAEQLSFTDLQGQAAGPKTWAKKTVVLVFLGLECPVANGYVPTIKELQNSPTGQAVVWQGVHSERGVTAEQATAHAKEYQLQLPVILDSQQQLAAATGAQRLGQVVVLQDNQVVYRGRVDDRYATNGKRRDLPSQHDLRQALTAIAQGQQPSVFETTPFGCPIPSMK